MNRIDDGYYVVPKSLLSCGLYHGSRNHYSFYSGRLRKEEEEEYEDEEDKDEEDEDEEDETELVLIRQVEVALFKGNFKEKDKAQTLEHVPQGDRQ